VRAGDLGVAGGWGGSAQRRSRRRGNEAWAALAELTRVRARPGTPRALATAAAELADRLRKLGLAGDAALADWLSVRALVAGGRVAEAAERTAELARVPPGVSLETRLVHRLAAPPPGAPPGPRGRGPGPPPAPAAPPRP